MNREKEIIVESVAEFCIIRACDDRECCLSELRVYGLIL
jgi:hypothetical protein